MARHLIETLEDQKGNSCDAPPAMDMTRPLVDVSALLRSAIRRCEHKLESVGLEVGYQASYWTRVLSCERGITLDRIGRLPADIQLAMIDAWRAALPLALPQSIPHGERRRTPEMSDLTRLATERRVRIIVEPLGNL